MSIKPIKQSDLTGLFHFLSGRAPGQIFISILIGIASGVAYSLLIPLVLQSLRQDELFLLDTVESEPVFFLGFEVTDPQHALTFVFICLFILAARSLSQIIFQRVTIEAMSELRVYFCQRINQLPIINLERIGKHELTASLTSDVPGVLGGAAVFPVLLSNGATLLGVLGFLVVLDPGIFLSVLFFIFLGVITYRLPMLLAQRYFIRARDSYSSILGDYNGIVNGAKELKLNSERRNHYLKDALYKHINENMGHTKTGRYIEIVATNYGNLISFFAIGIVAYMLSGVYVLSQDTLVAVVMALLYTIGPVTAIINSVAGYIQGNVALKKLNRLLARMPIEEVEAAAPLQQFEDIHLEDIEFQYPGEEGFKVGPINLHLKAGEATYFVGGNGSGKSSIAKLISCHYRPASGVLSFGKQSITDDNLVAARQEISAIYTDFHLFTYLFGVSPDRMHLAKEYLKLLALDKVVKFENGSFSTLKLSDGQKKRLALIVSFLDDRKVCLFDEWAADQDPEFKSFFYFTLIPMLKNMGKIVIVISHDEAYFDQADNLVCFENGKVLKVVEKRFSAKSTGT